MTNFIEVTNVDGTKIMINIDEIACFFSIENASVIKRYKTIEKLCETINGILSVTKSIIKFKHYDESMESMIYVLESYDEIKAKINC